MVMCSAVCCKNRSATDKKSPGFSSMKMFSFPKDIQRKKLWINAIKRANWTPTNNSRVCQAHFEESMFLRKSVEGRWRLVHDAIPTLFQHSKKKNERKLPLNRNKDAEELLKKQRFLFSEHSYTKDPWLSNKEDDSDSDPDNDVKMPILSDIFIQEAPEIEVITHVPCSNCINLLAANKFLSAKVRNLQAKIAKNKVSIITTNKTRKKIPKKTISSNNKSRKNNNYKSVQ
nr:uncharacterized protein LOC121115779 isoform X1 [Lepeophtheirus salmonis]